MKKKLAIYVHYDANGVVKEYVLYSIKGLQEVVSEVLVVINGIISYEGRKALEELGVKLLIRENIGFDFWAWKAGIEYYGYNEIATYDELLLTNNSYYGPIYPYSEMWSYMDSLDCDFWGINRHLKLDKFIIENDPKSQILEHLQSYWLVFRKKILVSDDFKNYWLELSPYNSYNEARVYGEIKLTYYFETHGFKSRAYMDENKYNTYIKNNPTFLSDIQVIEDRCPILKRKFFYRFKHQQLQYALSYRVQILLEFLNSTNNYDINMIWDDLLTIAPMSVINDNLGLNYILPSQYASFSQYSDKKIACIIYIYPCELIDFCYEYIKKIPQYIDIIVVNTSQSVAAKCKECFYNVSNKIEYRIQENRGRDNSALLVTCKDIIDEYDYLCFVHAKISPYFQDKIISEEFRLHNFRSLLYSEAYINNVINCFDKNPKIGLLAPFPMQNGPYNIIGNEWSSNKEITKKYIEKYFSLYTIDLDPYTLVPFGGMFWIKTKALKTMTSYNWQYLDFPSEPLLQSDGLLTHCLERMLSFLVQHDGYISAYVAPDNYASNYLNNLYYLNRIMKVYLTKKLGFMSDLDLVLALQHQEIFNDNKEFKLKCSKIQYFKYKILSKLTCGKRRLHYKQKVTRYKYIIKG